LARIGEPEENGNGIGTGEGLTRLFITLA